MAARGFVGDKCFFAVTFKAMAGKNVKDSLVTGVIRGSLALSTSGNLCNSSARVPASAVPGLRWRGVYLSSALVVAYGCQLLLLHNSCMMPK